MEFSLRLFRIQVSTRRVRIELQYRRSSGDLTATSSSQILGNDLPFDWTSRYFSQPDSRRIEELPLPTLVESIGQ